MKLNLNFKQREMSGTKAKNIFTLISNIWRKIHTFLFFITLVIFIALGAYIWEKNVYSGEWSDNKKQEHLNAQNRGVIFEENNFKEVLEDISSRKENLIKEYQPIKDLFKPF